MQAVVTRRNADMTRVREEKEMAPNRLVQGHHTQTDLLSRVLLIRVKS